MSFECEQLVLLWRETPGVESRWNPTGLVASSSPENQCCFRWTARTFVLTKMDLFFLTM